MAQMKAQGSLTIIDTNDIESITVEYARNQSTSSPPTSGWSTTRPTWEQGYYIWQRTRIHKTGTSDSEDTFGTAVCITGSTGQTGASLTVSSIRYAISTTESQPADSSFTYTTVPTVAEGSWLWTKTEYSDGSKIYTKSKQGKSGNSVTVTKVEYQSGTSPTTAPTGTWNTSIPTVAEGNYLWTKTTYSDGNYSYTVAKQGQSGTSVTISSTSVQYQIGSSATTAPTGTWQNSVQATTTGQYLWTRTIVTYSDSSSTTSYSVAAHGSTGTSVSVSSIKYAVTTTESQPDDSSFSTTFPSTVAEGSWLWTLTTYSNGSKMYTKSKQGKSGEDGRGLTATETKYTNVASGTTQTQVEALAESAWVTNVPSYDTSKPDYWIRVKNTYDKAPTTVYIYYKDNATGESLYNAAMANSIAQSANENANGAMSQAAANIQTITRLWYAKANSTAPAAPTTHITTSSVTTYNAWNIKRPNTNDSYPYYFYCDETCTGGGVYSWSEVALDTSNLSQYQIGALTAKVKNYWWDSAGAHIASGTSSASGEINASSPTSDYGYNTLTGLTGISFRYNDAKVVDLNSTTPSLDFYQPPTISGSTVTQGKKTMMLSSNALTFYDPSNGTTEQAKLNTNGLVLKKGGITSGCNYHIEAINNPSSENLYYYYELINNNYVKTEDEEIINGKTYYAYELDDPTQEQYTYMSTEDFPVVTTVGAGIDKNDWRLLVGTKFGVDNTGNLYAYGGQIGNENSYINISEYGINIINSNLDISINSLNTAVQASEWNENHIIYELTDDTSIEYVIVDEPVVEDISSYYEYNEEYDTYELTEDTEIDNNKIYYTFKTYYQLIDDYINVELIYLQVENPIIADINQYYEFNGSTYIKTQDTQIIKNKKYYIFDETQTYYIVLNSSDSPQQVDIPVQAELDSYYEKINNIYVKTQDTQIVTGKIYYLVTFVEDSSFTGGPYYQYITYQPYEFQSGEINPHNLGLYELIGTESIVDFIGTHFNFTDNGLYITDSVDSEYQLLINSNGVSVFNNNSIISKFGSNIEFASDYPQKIGGENSYIQFIPANTNNNTPEQIIIAADSILIGSTNAGDKFDELDDTLQQTQNDFSNALEIQNQTLTIHQQSLDNLNGYVEIDNTNGYIRVGKRGTNSYVQIDGNDTKVAINIEGNPVAYMSGERFFAPSAVITNLYMKTDLSSDNPTGAIGWVMRNNGHLSLKLIS